MIIEEIWEDFRKHLLKTSHIAIRMWKNQCRIMGERPKHNLKTIRCIPISPHIQLSNNMLQFPSQPIQQIHIIMWLLGKHNSKCICARHILMRNYLIFVLIVGALSALNVLFMALIGTMRFKLLENR